MKKTYAIKADCAKCAAKMEETVKQTAGVTDAVVNYMLLKLKVTFAEGADPKAVMAQARTNVRKIDDELDIDC